jgi:hypothetical protein
MRRSTAVPADEAVDGGRRRMRRSTADEAVSECGGERVRR